MTLKKKSLKYTGSELNWLYIAIYSRFMDSTYLYSTLLLEEWFVPKLTHFIFVGLDYN